MNETFEHNLKAIDRKLPGWRAYIEEKKYEYAKEDGITPYIEQVEVTTEQAYNGETISRVHYEGRSCYLAGKYNPARYAEYRAKKIEDKGFGAVILVLGFSDGRFLKELMRQKSRDVLVLVYEPCLEIFLHSLREYDVSELFSEQLIGIMVDGINGNEFEAVIRNTLFIENLAKFRVIIMENYEKLFPDQIRKAVDFVKHFVNALNVQWNTMVNFTNQSIYNCIKNLRVMYDHYNFNSLHRILPKNVPAIIVGAGPSLDKNIDQLRQAKGKACIIACDTALKPLIRHGIIPDMFAVVDPKKPMELFELPEILKIPVLTGLNVPYQLLEQHQGAKILYYDTAIEGKIQQVAYGALWNTPKYYMGGIPTGGNVAATAFSAARLMGAQTIIMMGQDMALTGEKEHAEGTFRSDRKFDLKKGNLPMVEGMDGTAVPTLPIMKVYIEWFEEQIRSYPDLKVINATEGGAKVHGSRQIALEQAITRYCKCKKQFSLETYLKKTDPHFTEEARRNVGNWMREMPERMKALEKLVVKGGNDYRKLEKLVAKNGYSVVELKKILKRLGKMNNQLDQDEEAALIMEGLKGVEYTLRTQMYDLQDDNQRDLIETARIGYKFMQSMQIVLHEMAPAFEEVAEYFDMKMRLLQSHD